MVNIVGQTAISNLAREVAELKQRNSDRLVPVEVVVETVTPLVLILPDGEKMEGATPLGAQLEAGKPATLLIGEGRAWVWRQVEEAEPQPGEMSSEYIAAMEQFKFETARAEEAILEAQAEAVEARADAAAAHGLADQASLDAAEANNAAVAAAADAMALAMAGPSLVRNGGFEEGQGNWTIAAGQAIVTEVPDAWSGTRVMRFESLTANSYPRYETFHQTAPGRVYRIEYMARRRGPGSAPIGFVPGYIRSDGTQGSPGLTVMGSLALPEDEWTKVAATWTAPEAVTQVRFSPWITQNAASAGTVIDIDDFAVYDITEAQAAIDAAEAAALESAAAIAAANSAITNVVPEYARNTSETTAPTSGWTENPPGRLPGTFIWRRDRVTYGDESTNTTPPVLTTGNTGPRGEDGTSVSIKGRVATSSALPTSGVTDGDGYIVEDTGHLWVRSGATWIDAGLIRGPQGEPGTPGSPGADGVSVLTITPYYRRQLTSAAEPARPTTMNPPSGWVTTEPEWQPLTSLWRTERIVYSGGSFAWTLVTKVAAWEIAAKALTSANGKNARITRTAAPTAANTTNPITGGELTEGDTWWHVDSMTTLNAIGAWEWDGSAWVRTMITSEVITNLDLLKLTVSGSARMEQAVVDKIIGDAGHFGLLTAERLVVAPESNLVRNGFGEFGIQRGFIDDSRVAFETTDTPEGVTGYISRVGAIQLQGQSVHEAFAVEAGEEFLVELWLRADNPDSRIYVEVRDQSNAHGATHYPMAGYPSAVNGASGSYIASNWTVPMTWTKYTSRMVANEGATTLRVGGIYFNHSNGSEQGAQQDIAIRIRRRTGGVLIENGAITAEKIHSKALIGVRIATSDTGPRLEVDPDGLSRWRSDGVDGLVRTIHLGGSGADELGLYDDTGKLGVGLTGDGTMSVRGEASVGSLRVGGDSLNDILYPYPKGIVAHFSSATDSAKAGTNEIGLARLSYRHEGGRLYRLHLYGLATGGNAGDTIRFQIRYATGGTNAMITSSGIEIFDYPKAVATFNEVSNHALMPAWTATYNVSLLLTMRNNTANRPVGFYGRSTAHWGFWVEDIGPIANSNIGVETLAGGTPYESYTPPAPEKQTYTKTYTATNARSWRGSGTVSDVLHHGYFDGYQRYSQILFPSTVRTDLSGATIVKVELFMRNVHTYYSTPMQTRILAATNTSLASSPNTTTGQQILWAKGAAAWVTISGWTPTSQSIFLGGGAGTALQAYGKFSNTLSDLRLRVTYTK